MIPLLSREAMQTFDNRAITSGVPGQILMENAGRGATAAILHAQPLARRFLVVCGAGNNGGDGYVVARHLLARDRLVTVVGVTSPDALAGDAKRAYEMFAAVGGEVLRDLPSPVDFDVVVDAVFGTGLSRPVEGPLHDVLARLSEGRFVVALDLPSGLDATTGHVWGVAVRAHLTITFGHPKAGLFTPAGKAHRGDLRTTDIGVPPTLGDIVPTAWCAEESDVRALLPLRAADTHKHREGRVLIVAGSRGATGALVLAGEGALRAGAGLVTLATWADAAASVEARVREAMTASLDGDDPVAAIDPWLLRAKAVVIGPGLGLDDRARDLCRHVALRHLGPAVLDADALTHLALDPDALAAVRDPRILLPHEGELARLLGTTAAVVSRDRFRAVREVAARTGATVVLKGPCTLVCHRDDVTVLDVGTPALATAGSGDVLAGIVGAFLARAPARAAALLGVWAHGKAAEAWTREHGDRGMLASEIAARVPDALRACHQT